MTVNKISLEDLHYEATKTARKLHNYLDSSLSDIKGIPRYQEGIKFYSNDLKYQVGQLLKMLKKLP